MCGFLFPFTFTLNLVGDAFVLRCDVLLYDVMTATPLLNASLVCTTFQFSFFHVTRSDLPFVRLKSQSCSEACIQSRDKIRLVNKSQLAHLFNLQNGNDNEVSCELFIIIPTSRFIVPLSKVATASTVLTVSSLIGLKYGSLFREYA